MQQTLFAAFGFRGQFQVVNVATVLIGVLLAITVLIKESNSMMAPPSPNRPDAGQTHEPRLVRPLYEFGGKLLVELNKRSSGDKNVVLSPVSIHLGLSMVLLGSDSSSQTKQELMSAIGYSNMSESDIKQCQENYAKIMTDFKRITSDTLKDRKEFEANKAQIKKQSPYELAYKQPRSPLLDLFTMLVTKNKAQVRGDYEKEIKKYFQATIGNIDDKKPETKTHLLKTMNDWAKEAGFEKPVMSEEYLNDDFSAILLSAIRVEAFWSDDFSELEDKKVFYNYGSKDKPVGGKCLTIRDLKGSRFIEFTSGERAKVKYLHESMSKNETYNKLAKLDFRAIELPLRDGLNFVIFEPLVDDTSSAASKPTSTTPKLNKLTASLFSPYDKDAPVTNLAKVLGLLDLTDNDNELDYLRMPKFKFESHIDDDLKSALGSIGINRAFDDKRAEIRQITGEELFIKDIKHKAMIEATKTGIKAAGLTMVKMSMRSAAIGKSENIRVTIENPFMFVIRYQRIPLFVGQLTNL